MILYLHFHVSLNLRCIVQLFFRSEGSIATSVFLNSLLPVIVRVIDVTWYIRRRSIHLAPSHVSLTVLPLQGLIVIDDLMPDRHILSLDHVHDDLALLDKLNVLGRLLLNQRLQFASLHKEFVAKGNEEVCVVRELFFFDDGAVG